MMTGLRQLGSVIFLWMVTGRVGFAQIPGLGGGKKADEYPHPEDIDVLPPLTEPLAWWVIALLIMGGLVLLALLIWLLMRERPPKGVVKPPALRTALTKMNQLKKELDELEPAEAAHRVSVILREFQELKHDLPAPYRTREELYEGWRAQAPRESIILFSSLAEVHDRLAFGPQLSSREDVRVLIEDAVAALEGKVKTPPPLPQWAKDEAKNLS